VIFEEFYTRLLQRVFGEIIGTSRWDFFKRNGAFASSFHYFDDLMINSLQNDKLLWGESGTRDSTFKLVINEVLEEKTGKELLPYGSQTQIVMKNIFFDGSLPSILGFDLPITVEGGRATVVQGQIFEAAGGRMSSFNPSFRYVTDMGQNHIESALAGGPSARRFSGLYTTDVERWLNYEYKQVGPQGERQEQAKKAKKGEL